MKTLAETADADWSGSRGRDGKALPGIVLVFSAGQPQLLPVPVTARPFALGRGAHGALVLEDARLSRAHAEVSFDGTTWTVRDLGSRNGTALDGERITGEVRQRDARVLRAGETIFLLCADVRPYAGRVEVREGRVVGPTLKRAYAAIEGVAQSSDVLHVTGASGAGKELAARHFHASGPARGGPFVAVNCATIPGALAERLLFGARKGAYSGADADAEGSVQSAHGGTLFLDEIAELEPAVQAKLLRVIETREVVPLGASRGRRVELRLVSATHGDLRERVAAGRFREDLFFRLGRPSVALPALRERPEEIPWLLSEALRGRTDAAPHASLVEAALLRHWPGNVREFFVEVREAARVAGVEGSAVVEARHLDARAGLAPAPVSAAASASAGTPRGAGSSGASEPNGEGSARGSAPEREELARVLAEAGGNVSQAARTLGVHRTQLRRWMARYGLGTAD